MLIDEIIQLLSENDKRLTDALLKTKLLLHKIGKKELTEWVNFELNGYPDKATLPEYRVLQSRLLGNASNGGWRIAQHPLPTGHLKPDMRKSLSRAELRQSLSILENMDGKGILSREMPPESYGELNRGLDNGYKVERAWCATPAHDVLGILTQVRSRLLDFCLELKDSVGNEVTDESLRQKADAVNTTELFQQTVFGSIGDNATIILGTQNAVATRNEVKVGDFASLAQALRFAGIPDGEIESLKGAIAEDKQSGTVALSEGKTGHWFLKLLGKAADGTVKVGTDVLSRVVTEALTGFLKGS